MTASKAVLVTLSEDGRWLVVTTSVGTDDRYEVTLIDLKKKGAKPRTLIKGFDNNYSYVGNEGETFFFVTNDGALAEHMTMLARHGGVLPADRTDEVARGRRAAACRPGSWRSRRPTTASTSRPA